MTVDKFNAVVKDFINKTEATLLAKQDEYNLSKDRFEFFKRMADIEHCTPEQSLAHCVTKHITSFYDMINSEEKFTKQRWFDKLGDITNYMILLYGLLEDDGRFKEDLNVDSR